MKPFLAAFLIFGFTINSAKAASAQDSYDWLYEETLEQCGNANATWFSAAFNRNTLQAGIISVGQSLKLVLFASGTAEELKDYTNHSFISDYTYDRLNSEGFQKAVFECFPGRSDLQRNFVISMMVADNLGKAPAVIGSVALFKGSKMAFTKLSLTYPKIALFLQRIGMVAVIATPVLEIRKIYLASQLTPEEEARVNALSEQFKQGDEAARLELLEMALDTKAKLEAKLDQTTDPSLRSELQQAVGVLNKEISTLKG